MMPGLFVDGARLIVQGLFNDSNAMAVHGEGLALLKSIAQDHLEIVVDMQGVTHVGSAALAVILSWCRFLKPRGQHLVLETPPENLISIIRVCGVVELIEVRSPAKATSTLDGASESRAAGG